MRLRSKLIANIRALTIICSAFCAVGAGASLFVILVRVPALSTNRLEVLLGTLQGTAVGLLFGIVALLVNLTYLVYRTSSLSTGSTLSDGGIHQG